MKRAVIILAFLVLLIPAFLAEGQTTIFIRRSAAPTPTPTPTPPEGITIGNVTAGAHFAWYEDTLTVEHNNDGNFLVVDYAHAIIGEVEPTGCTYNGVSLTRLAGINPDGYATRVISRWILTGPAGGTNNVVCSFADDGIDGVLIIRSFDGVDTADPVDTTVTAEGGGGDPITATVSSATGQLLIDVIHVYDDGTTTVSNAGTGQTKQSDHATSESPGDGTRAASSYKDGASSVDMEWDVPDAGAWAMIVTPLKPAS